MGIGAGNLLAWSDSGKLVPKEQAESRSTVCVNANSTAGRLANVVYGTSSSVADSPVECKNAMKLETTKDDQLGVCEVCACPLPLKSLSPLEYALRKMSEETKASCQNGAG
jgi:hypothetical protein